MQTVRHVRLFRNGRNQALRIPREYEFEGKEAIIYKDGDRPRQTKYFSWAWQNFQLPLSFIN